MPCTRNSSPLTLQSHIFYQRLRITMAPWSLPLTCWNWTRSRSDSVKVILSCSVVNAIIHCDWKKQRLSGKVPRQVSPLFRGPSIGAVREDDLILAPNLEIYNSPTESNYSSMKFYIKQTRDCRVRFSIHKVPRLGRKNPHHGLGTKNRSHQTRWISSQQCPFCVAPRVFGHFDWLASWVAV